MWSLRKKTAKVINEDFAARIASERAAWETYKNELCIGGEDYIFIKRREDSNRKKFKAIALGFYVHSLEIFSDLVPTSLDIMEILLKDCFVFTHIYDNTSNPDDTFAKTYTTSLRTHNWKDGEYFCNENMDSFVTLTKGIDRPTLQTFYDVVDGNHYMEGLVYGFLENPRDAAGNDYASIADFLSKDTHSVLMLSERDHVNLYINLNSGHFNEGEVIRVIQNVCEKNGKNLHGI
ncbi:hypothetical protein AGMMS49975_28310 [Clostridia bacterium]|nr:hypothetical protein AGMMS49975_28310 [Clostridia bacterium]